MPTRPNYIEMYAWGRKPRSKRRRRAALFAWLGPTVLFLFVLFVGGIVAFSIDQANNLNTASFRPFGSHAFMAASVGMFIASWLGGFGFCFLLPFLLENRCGNANMLQANLADYKLAGFMARQMLKGLAAPQLRGIHLFSLVYPLLTGILLLFFATTRSNAEFIPTIVITAVVGEINLLAGTYFSLALWSKPASKGERAFKTGMFTISPFLGLCVAVPAAIILNFIIGDIAALVWLAALLLPIAIAVKTWNGAIRRIDTPPTDDDLAFLPPSPAKSAAVAADPADTRD